LAGSGKRDKFSTTQIVFEMRSRFLVSRVTRIRAKTPSVARVLLAVVFLLSGISKLLSPAGASSFVAGMIPMTADMARILVIPLSLAEIAAACLLLFDRWVTAVAFLSSFFFLSAFVVGLLYLGEEKPCGCFGDLFVSQTDQWFLSRSLGLLFLSLFVLRNNGRHEMAKEMT
jgi:uncharacterized membrane protein YphA (DoxX/SURF4 family)